MDRLTDEERNRRIRERRERYEAQLIDQGIMLEDARRAAELRFSPLSPSFKSAYPQIEPRCSQDRWRELRTWIEVGVLVIVLIAIGVAGVLLLDATVRGVLT
ncbi:MAG TPA: hypothetical protein VF638_14250 [Sphingomonas sp.]|jgi:hypothetical protein